MMKFYRRNEMNEGKRTVNFRGREPPCRYTVLKESVQLGVRPAPRLGYPEIHVDNAERAATEPEEGTLLPPIPGSRAQHPGHNDSADNVDDLIRHSRQSDGFLPKPR